MEGEILVSDDFERSLKYLDIVKLEQERRQEELDFIYSKYMKLFKVFKANEVLIKSLEDNLGIKSNKKSKSKNQEKNNLEEMVIDIPYDQNATVSQKAEYALRKEKKELTTNQILEVLYDVDKTITKEAHKIYASKFSATILQKANKEQIFYRLENENEPIRWGLIEWRINAIKRLE